MAEEKNSSGEEIMEDGLPGPSLNKQSENALRRRAERLGFELHKSRRRDRQAPDYDRYALIDLVTKKPLGGTLALVGLITSPPRQSSVRSTRMRWRCRHRAKPWVWRQRRAPGC